MSPEALESRFARLDERLDGHRRQTEMHFQSLAEKLDAMRAAIADDTRRAVRICAKRHRKRCPGDKLRAQLGMTDDQPTPKSWVTLAAQALAGLAILGGLIGGAVQQIGQDKPAPQIAAPVK